MKPTPAAKAAAFRQLHAGPAPFLLPNPWDAGSARILAGLGFSALATSSAAAAATLGRRDGALSRTETLAHARALAEATDLPVAGDLEDGFGLRPEDAAETIRLSAEAGLVGGSIEDFSRESGGRLIDFNLAVERVAAAAEAARALPFPFMLTARAEGFLRQAPDLDEILRRLAAFERAGADVLFAPGPPDLSAVRAICQAVRRPVNFMVGIRGRSFSVAELQAAGVRRISFSASLYRAAMGALASSAREARERGTFGYLEATPTTAELLKLLGA
jgi:2-methylisocitrate lyase-like PEP mutase family enzyme